MLRAITHRVITAPALAAVFASSLVGGLVVPTQASASNNSLTTPITGASLDAMWPIAVEVEIVRVDTDGETVPRTRSRAVLERQRSIVPDGHELHLHSAVRTDRGRREFALSVTAHQHPGDAVELEWSLQVRDAEYRKLDAPSYLLHRLQLSNVLELAEPTLKIARADIVSVRREGHTQRLEIDGEVHEIRIFARSMRG